MRKLLRRSRDGNVADLTTQRLTLVAISASLLAAEAAGTEQLGRALHAKVAPDWPPELWSDPVRAHIKTQIVAQPYTGGWCRYVLLRGRPGTLVGSVGAFPCAAGDAELGYSVVRSQQRRGIAREAVDELVSWLLMLPEVRSVSAQAYVAKPESIKVMERCGLRSVGSGDEPGTVRYRRWATALDHM